MAERNLVCTFCKRSEHQVRKLVAGPNVFICGECTDRAHALVHEGFYASVSRDGATIHRKCAPKLEAECAHRRVGAHLDAYLDVRGVRALHADLLGRGAPIHTPLTEQA